MRRKSHWTRRPGGLARAIADMGALTASRPLGNTTRHYRNLRADVRATPSRSDRNPETAVSSQAIEGISSKASPVFVSHARSDKGRVASVLSGLRRRGFGFGVDQHEIPGGAPWRARIVDAILQCSVVLFFVTTDSCASAPVLAELSIADDKRKPVVPVFLDEVSLPKELRYLLTRFQQIDLKSGRVPRAAARVSPGGASWSPRTYPLRRPTSRGPGRTDRGVRSVVTTARHPPPRRADRPAGLSYLPATARPAGALRARRCPRRS